MPKLAYNNNDVYSITTKISFQLQDWWEREKLSWIDQKSFKLHILSQTKSISANLNCIYSLILSYDVSQYHFPSPDKLLLEFDYFDR